MRSADIAKLRTRSGHAIHVKRIDNDVSDATSHSPMKRLIHYLANPGMDPKSGEAKGMSSAIVLAKTVPCKFQTVADGEGGHDEAQAGPLRPSFVSHRGTRAPSR